MFYWQIAIASDRWLFHIGFYLRPACGTSAVATLLRDKLVDIHLRLAMVDRGRLTRWEMNFYLRL